MTYDCFTQEQVDQYKKKMHSKIHWLLIYKEADDCKFFDCYFEKTIKFFKSLNKVLNYNPTLIELVAVLQLAYDEAHNDEFSFKEYRSHILEAHNIVDRL